MNTKKFVFIDLETGGLNNEKINGTIGSKYYPILQVAIILTNSELEEIAEPLNITIKQEKEDIKRCSEWSKEYFKNTLMVDCLKSEITTNQAENIILNYLKNNGIKEFEGIMAGNSIQLDRSFLSEQMNRLSQYLHYRMLDISSINIFLNGVGGKNIQFNKKREHDALADIRESVGELKYYKEIIKSLV
tara:strand:- start:1019 stop:1585 length:567 start_codon:yes stop_codon:yes gene_type:complete